MRLRNLFVFILLTTGLVFAQNRMTPADKPGTKPAQAPATATAKKHANVGMSCGCCKQMAEKKDSAASSDTMSGSGCGGMDMGEKPVDRSSAPAATPEKKAMGCCGGGSDGASGGMCGGKSDGKSDKNKANTPIPADPQPREPK